MDKNAAAAVVPKGKKRDAEDEIEKATSNKKKKKAAKKAKKQPLAKNAESSGGGTEDSDSREEEASMSTFEKQTSTKEPKLGMNTQSQASGSKILSVGNVPLQAVTEDLKILFEQVGEVDHVRFLQNDDGSPTGFCRVEFVSAEAAKKAHEVMNGHEMLGQKLNLELGTSRSGRGGRFGRIGRGGGRAFNRGRGHRIAGTASAGMMTASTGKKTTFSEDEN